MTTKNERNKVENLACLIIDDPPLKPQYGCLDYERLLREMKEHRFFTEIAFIPWNYKRSNPRTVRLFAENPDYFALCVHGCNHSGNEFGGGDHKELSTLVTTALWRMEEHKKRTGLPYDPVIVFPQGHFSSVAMKVLKDQGFYAAFNSTLRATDGDELPDVEYRRPVTTIYHDFPLFLRRYPKDRSDLLQDLAAGRPIIIVEHHGVFRNGYQEITDLIDWINSQGNIKWKSLSDIATHYCGKIEKPLLLSNTMPLRPKPWYNTKVALRRMASEIRDNYIETNNVLTKAYKMLRA